MAFLILATRLVLEARRLVVVSRAVVVAWSLLILILWWARIYFCDHDLTTNRLLLIAQKMTTRSVSNFLTASTGLSVWSLSWHNHRLQLRLWFAETNAFMVTKVAPFMHKLLVLLEILFFRVHSIMMRCFHLHLLFKLLILGSNLVKLLHRNYVLLPAGCWVRRLFNRQLNFFTRSCGHLVLKQVWFLVRLLSVVGLPILSLPILVLLVRRLLSLVRTWIAGAIVSCYVWIEAQINHSKCKSFPERAKYRLQFLDHYLCL